MEWFADDSFWREFYPVMFSAARFEAAPAQIGQIAALTGIREGAVLDLCCGPGRHAVELARVGYRVTGVDRSPFLLSRAQERAAELGVAVEWVDCDMREFRRPGAFALALSLFTSFGYFEREEENVAVLRNVYESLQPGGAFAIELLGKEKLARVWRDSICEDLSEGVLLLQRPTVIDDWMRLRNEWRLIRPEGNCTFTVEHWIYSGGELKTLLQRAGFEDIRLFGDLQGAPYGLDAMRLVAVCRKLAT